MILILFYYNWNTFFIFTPHIKGIGSGLGGNCVGYN